ncbi:MULTISPECIES: hypothetical protein [Bacillaceae]|nr:MULTISPECIES: hypothetical protein [Bacillaceae]MCF2647252.1 hypothetical protein [Niallia circulans]CAI9390221.1 hypothetical protein BACSP_02752 [Bacillus sp. T2.9-1]
MKPVIYVFIIGWVLIISGCGNTTNDSNVTLEEAQSESLETVSFHIDGFT